jgi:hypothetical protein
LRLPAVSSRRRLGGNLHHRAGAVRSVATRGRGARSRALRKRAMAAEI